MKKRVRTQPTNPYYSTEPAVSRKLIAGQGMIPNAALGNATNKIIPKHPGRMSGVAGFSSKNKPIVKRSGITTPKLGSTPKQPAKTKVKR